MKITRIINGQEITIELTAEEMRRAYYEIDRECLRDDVLQWAEESDKTIDDELLEDILRELDKSYDSNMGHWDNIQSAYNWQIYLRQTKKQTNNR